MVSRIRVCAEQAVRAGRTCEARQCHLPVEKVSRYCRKHSHNRERYGDPLGRHIYKSELKAYKRLAAKYIAANRAHSAIAAALRWLHNLLYNSPAPPTHPNRRMSPQQRSLRFLSRLAKNGVTAEGTLCLIVALEMMREHDPFTFVSDAHYRAMLAHHVCRLAPGPFVAVWRGGIGGRKYDRLSVGTRNFLASKVISSIGLVALGAARAILKVETLENSLLKGVNVPINFQPTTKGKP